MQNYLNRDISQFVTGGFSAQQASGSLPGILPSPLYLNLGCGNDVREGFVNIDLFSDNPTVVAMDIRHLDLPNHCADGILASDVLEHFSHREVAKVLREWARVLKPGGELLIRCPSLKLQAQAYLNGSWDADIASYMIFGGQTNPGDYHCVGFDTMSITRHLAEAGLNVESIEEVDTPQTKGFINLNMTVRSRKPLQATATQPAPQIGTGNHQLNIVWEGTFFRYHSLALINRNIAEQLLRADVAELTLIPYEEQTQGVNLSPEDFERYSFLKNHFVFNKDLYTESSSLPYAHIRHQWPPKSDDPKGARWIVMQPWEYGGLPVQFKDLLEQCDEVWTPTWHSVKMFRNAVSKSDKVQLVPNGVDPTVFSPAPQAVERSPKLTFLYIGGLIFRKGVDIMLTSWVNSFTKNDNVRLIIKSIGNSSFYQGSAADSYTESIRKVVNNSQVAEVIYIEDDLSEREIADLYRMSDVFLSPYRAESFSLPTLEAMACGLPVIVPAGGATDDFTDESTGWHIDATIRKYGTTLGEFELLSEATMLEPDVNHLNEILKSVYNNPQTIISKGIQAAFRARSQWTWRHTTIKLLSRLDASFGTTMTSRAEQTLPEFSDAMILIGKGEMLYTNGELDEAIDCFTRAFVERGLPTNYALLGVIRLATLALADGDTELGAQFLEKAVTVGGAAHPDVLLLQARVQAGANDWEGSLETLRVLLDDWHSAKFHIVTGFSQDVPLTELGRAMHQLGDLESAHTLYMKALEINHDNADACYGVALCFLEADAKESAITMFDWAIRLNPGYQELVDEALAGV